MISYFRLYELIIYNPITGIMTWKISRGKCIIGMEVGRLQWQGYRQVFIDGKSYYVHRLIFFYMTGDWPSEDVDHINQIKNDNRWCNLREATRSENKANQNKQINNKIGLRGVSWNKRDKIYMAEVKKGKIRIRLGFNCPAAAYFAYIVESHKLFGKFVPGSEI